MHRFAGRVPILKYKRGKGQQVAILSSDVQLSNYAHTVNTSKMEELTVIFSMCYVMILLGLFAFRHLTSGHKTLYGRYVGKDIGLRLDARLAWFLQEFPSFVVPFYLMVFTNGQQHVNVANKFILYMFTLHYFQR